MSAARLLEQLRAAGAQLRVAGGRLEAKHLPPALAPLARAHAVELRRLLASPPPADLPPEAMGLDPDDPAALVARGAESSDWPPPSTPADRWGLLPPSPVPFHMRPEVLGDPTRCLGCGARAMHLAQCMRCGCLAPVQGPVLPDPPPEGPPAVDSIAVDAPAAPIAPIDLPITPAARAAVDLVAEVLGAQVLELRPRRRPWAPAVEGEEGQGGVVHGDVGGLDVAELGAPIAALGVESVIGPAAPLAASAPCTVPTALEAALEPPAPPRPAPLPPFAWREVLTALPEAPAPGPWAPMANPLDAPPGPRARVAAVELPAPPEAPGAAAAAVDAPDEPLAVRAARFGYVILPSGEYVEAHRAAAPHVAPFQARFAVGYQPADDPRGEGERWRQRTAAAVDCARKLGPRPGGPTAAPLEAPQRQGEPHLADRPQAPRPGLYLVRDRLPPAPPPPGWGWHGGANCRRCGRQGQYSGPRGHHCPDCSGPPPPEVPRGDG